MTILKIHIDDEDKEKVRELSEELSEIQNEKLMSEYDVRKVLAEKIKIQEVQEGQKQIDEIKIPDYIPKNKYVGFVKGAIIGVADSPNEIAQIAVNKFPNDPLIIKYNGAKKKQIEYSYLNLTELNCWKYAQIEETSYPIFPMVIKTKLEEKKLAASIDTASSLCVLKEDIHPRKDFKISREERIATASGIVKSKIYIKGKLN